MNGTRYKVNHRYHINGYHHHGYFKSKAEAIKFAKKYDINNTVFYTVWTDPNNGKYHRLAGIWSRKEISERNK